MEGTAYRTKGDVLRRAQEIVGIPLKEVDASGRLATGSSGILPTPKPSPIFPRQA